MPGCFRAMQLTCPVYVFTTISMQYTHLTHREGCQLQHKMTRNGLVNRGWHCNRILTKIFMPWPACRASFEGPVWCNSTDVGSNPGRSLGVRNDCRRKEKYLATPSVRIAELRAWFWERNWNIFYKVKWPDLQDTHLCEHALNSRPMCNLPMGVSDNDLSDKNLWNSHLDRCGGQMATGMVGS